MPKQPIQLSDHFTYSRLVRFVLPCIGTMLFTSIYGIVDGLCVSNFVGKTAFAAVNLIMPLPMLIGTIGFMLGTGGSAIVGITLGEGDNKKADEFFSLFLIAALVAGIVFTGIGLLIIEPVAALLGAKGEMLDYALRYGRILLISLPTFILQNMFQSFFVTAEKPHLGFAFTVGAGCTNMVPDRRQSAAGVLFCKPEQHEPAAPQQDQVQPPCPDERLCQRLFRADDQPLDVDGQHPL